MAERRTILDLVAGARERVEEVTVDGLAAELAAGDVVLLDIRDIRERLTRGSIPGARSVPRGMLEFWLDPASPYARDTPDPDARTLVYCAGGMRSALAADRLRELGWTDVAHLEVGFDGWAEAGGAVEDVSADSSWVRREGDG